MTARTKICGEHGTPMRTEPLTRFDGTQIGSLTVDICDRCDTEARDNFESFLDRVCLTLTTTLGSDCGNLPGRLSGYNRKATR